MFAVTPEEKEVNQLHDICEVDLLPYELFVGRVDGAFIEEINQAVAHLTEQADGLTQLTQDL